MTLSVFIGGIIPAVSDYEETAAQALAAVPFFAALTPVDRAKLAGVSRRSLDRRLLASIAAAVPMWRMMGLL
jgi:hypothetical protein